MNHFEYHNPVKILFGIEQFPKIAELIPENKKIILLYGSGSIYKNGVYDRLISYLSGKKFIEFGGIEPNPTYETCMKAVEKIKNSQVDFLLAAGGGSVIDAAKFIAAAALYDRGDPWDILTKSAPVNAALPIGAVLTLPATGSEMNKNSVISRASTHEKFPFSSPYVFPQFSVLLPEAAATLPSHQVANGVVDAFVHVIEQYINYPVNAPLQDRFAEAVLLTLIEEGPKAFKDPANTDAMSNLMWAATMALNGLLSCGVPTDWSVHHIGHELTALHQIDHARTLAIVLPGVWKVLKDAKKEKLLQYGKRVWNISGGNEDDLIEATIERTIEFFESLGIRTRLSDYNAGKNTIETIVHRFETRGWTARGDRGLVTPVVLRKVLEDRL